MIEHDEIIRRRIDTQINEYAQLVENFKPVGDRLSSFELRPLTRAIIEEVQVIIDDFVHTNQLGIAMSVYEFDGGLICMGATLKDELVWEAITQNYK